MSTEKGTRIVGLKVENVKRIKAVALKPDGHSVVISGRNEQGKSSLLDAIEYAFGGKPSVAMPVRKGQPKARVVAELDDIIVRRTFTAQGGGNLVVTNKEGAPILSPQTLLDKLTGKLTFDPLEFAKMKPEKQADELRKIVGMDFSALDADHKKNFDARTIVNREVDTLAAQLKANPKFEGVPEVEVSAAEIITEQQAALETNEANRKVRDRLEKAKMALSGAQEALGEANDTIADVERRLAAAKATKDQLTLRVTEAEAAVKTGDELVKALKDVDMEPFKTRLAGCESVNTKVRANKVRAEIVTRLNTRREDAEKLTDKLDAIAAEKNRLVTEAKYPVPGLAFDAVGGITLDGIPFTQASTAQKIRVSVAIGIALNPALKILLIRSGNDLDEQSLKAVLEMAEASGHQVFIERVAVDGNTSVVIEDGSIQGTEEEPAEAPAEPATPAPATTETQPTLV